MALPDTLLVRLMEVIKDNELGGDFAMLGRQRWIGTRKGASARAFAAAMEKYLPGKTEADLKNSDDIYSENFFRALGFAQIDSIDFSEFEGASVVQDLTKPVPDSLVGRFDVIYDGGTTEHIFDIPKAYANIDAMLKPGGTLIGHSPCNNWINHAFYQINPEMVYGYWEKAMGYEIIDLILQPLLPNFFDRTARTTNPNETGVRPRILSKLPMNSPIMILYAVRKPLERGTAATGIYQTDYVEKWDREVSSPDA